MFNKELFLELCQRHGVEMASTTGKVQIREGNSCHDLKDDEITLAYSVDSSPWLSSDGVDLGSIDDRAQVYSSYSVNYGLCFEEDDIYSVAC